MQPQRFGITLSDGWRFALGEQPRAWLKRYDDAAWRTVTVPHDWAVEHPFSTEHSSGTGYLPGGLAYYRKAFALGESERGKQITLSFDGVYNNAMVWVNGYYLGKHPNGYTPFSFDITPFATYGEDENLLVVKVDHRHVDDSRWYTGSGIYRKVTVSARAPVSIAAHGVFVTTTQADAQAATLAGQVCAQNLSGKAVEATVAQTLLTSTGKEVASWNQTATIPAGEQLTVQGELSVDSPSLWSPDTPSLYRCETTVVVDGNVVDGECMMTGIRTFRFDADQGFFLNGVNRKMKGVCVHHDAGCLGAAVRPKVWRRRLETLKQYGCNAIRMSHNPHMPELYDLCDELGFLVIEEAFDEWEGVKNKWAKGHNVYPPSHYGYYEEFPAWHERDLTAMVLRGRNHPSIVLWSIGNEIDYPNDPYNHSLFQQMTGNNDANKPKEEMVFDPSRPNAERLVTIARELCAIVKRVDTTRPVTAALAFPELSTQTGLAAVLDVVGYNYKEHLYKEDHARFPQMFLLGSENGKEAHQWQAVLDNDFISGQFLWTGYDFLGETVGWPYRGSEAGLFDLAGFPKPIAYLRAAMWCEQPYAKLLYTDAVQADTHRPLWDAGWGLPDRATADVRCVTNGTEAELFLGEASLGTGQPVEGNPYTFTWRVPYSAGELRVVSRGPLGQAEDKLSPVGMGCRIHLQAYNGCAGCRMCGVCDGCRVALAADGLDMAHVIATVVDAQGNRVPNAENVLHVHVEGGSLLGLENGDQRDTQPYALPYRRARGGRLLVYLGAPAEEGEVSITVSCEGLLPATLTIAAQ